MLSRKAHLDSGEPSFTDQKKRMTTHFLSLVKPSPIHFLSHVEKNQQLCYFLFFIFLWTTACKEGHRHSPKRSSFTGNVLLGVNDQSISFKGSLFDVEPKKEGVWLWHRDEQDWQQILMTHDSWQVSLFFKLVL